MSDIKKQLQDLIKQSVEALFSIALDEVLLENPKDPSHGDFSTPIAMSLTKTLKDNPRNIALKIVSHIEKSDDLESVSVAGPGFINMTLKKEALETILFKLVQDPKSVTTSNIGNQEKILLEFVSVNPTGDMHIGHARGASAGMTLANVLSKAGFDVTKEYYVNDAGNQMDKLAESLYVRYLQASGKNAAMPDDGYLGPEIIELGKTLYDTYQDTYLDRDKALPVFKQEGLKRLMETIKKDLSQARVSFDVFYSETSLYENGHVEDVLNRLKDLGMTYSSDGALYLKTTLKGDEKDRVIVKKDGSYTYILPDIAYHEQKLKRGFTHLIDILGTDHHGYVARLKAALSMLGYDDVLEVLLLQIVRVMKDDVEIKMSKRSGKAYSLSDLLDEVGPDPIRYFFSARSLNSHMDLDLDLAVKQKSDNPVYYLQYAHARMASVFEKAESRGYLFDKELKAFETLNMEIINPILNLLNDYQTVIEKAALTREIHKLPLYLHKLSQAFHKWYSEEKIITEDALHVKERLYVLKAIQTVLKDGLETLGVEAKTIM